jgi:sterol desaturase/sphingolipid hydroxylase (fatty acid hydroxylase superfamily)
MGQIKRLAWWLCLFLACALLVVTGTTRVQQFASAHHGVAAYVLLTFLLAIPTSLVTLACGYLFELLLIGWSRSSLKILWEGRASVKLDALSIAMMMIPHKRLDYVLSFGLLYAIDSHAGQTASVPLTHFLPTWGIQIACVLVLHSFFSYWMHRMEHAIPALWALHQFHHSADRMTILTAERRTDLTRGMEAIILFLPFALLGNPTAAQPSSADPAIAFLAIVFAYTTFLRINGYLCHSNLETGYGWIGRWLLVSPRMHRLHHATLPQYHDKNFSFDLVIWDRLFGTYASCDAAALPDIPLGLETNPFNHSGTIKGVLREYFLTSYVLFWQELRKGFSAWLPGRTAKLSATPS